MDSHLFQKIGACMLLSFTSLFSYAEKLPLQVEMNLQNGAINQLKVEKCAYLYPYKIDGVKGQFYDPYANDQDWALVYYLLVNEGI